MVSGGGGAEQDLSLKTRAPETRASCRFVGENEIPPQFFDVICYDVVKVYKNSLSQGRTRS